ncbi:hypothetical protein [Cellulosimicrobium sp. CUA-896]|uniref:hypothetical protein n=1 Tax=Cellulosimicrobium sp. CUA-896 TaxID=1517881 RepID=UPI0009FB21E3
MPAVSGLGPWPGGQDADALQAQLTVLGDLAELPTGVRGVPFLVQLPARGPGADATGRAAALLPGMPVELGPHGWKLADHAGADERRAEAFRREDLEALAIAAAGYAGPLALAVRGPWTLAAELYLARGDRVLSDHGAVRDLVEAFAAGVADHVGEVRRQVPGADVVVQLDEPLLAQVAPASCRRSPATRACAPSRAPTSWTGCDPCSTRRAVPARRRSSTWGRHGRVWPRPSSRAPTPSASPRGRGTSACGS